jgi:hypothetical protein
MNLMVPFLWHFLDGISQSCCEREDRVPSAPNLLCSPDFRRLFSFILRFYTARYRV